MCNRKNKMKKPTQEELNEILAQHAAWLEDPATGKRADLRDSDLRGADLTGANLTDAWLVGAKFEGGRFVDFRKPEEKIMQLIIALFSSLCKNVIHLEVKLLNLWYHVKYFKKGITR
jgi:hypothetical protein